MIVTCWYRDTGDGPRFNHISHGFNPDHDEPAPMFESQKRAWRGGIWIGKEAELVAGVVIGGELPKGQAQLPMEHSA